MHTTAEYLAQAVENAELAKYLRATRPDNLDWAVTCLFYSAVHYVNAYLAHAKKGIPRRHTGSTDAPGRSNIVQQDPSLKAIYIDYRHLDDDSRDARYELHKPAKAEYDEKMVKRLVRIKTHISKKVGN